MIMVIIRGYNNEHVDSCLDNPRILNIHVSSIPGLSRVKFVNNSVLLAFCKKTASNLARISRHIGL